MKLSFKVITSLFFLSLSTKVLADKCDDLQKKYNIGGCETNADGEITNVGFYSVSQIKKNDLKGLKEVKHIRFEDCTLSQTNINEIATLTSLQELEFYIINYKDLDLSPIKNIQSLTFLRLHGDEKDENKYLTEIPSFIYTLKNLEKLDFSAHVLTSSPTFTNEIANLKNLKILEMAFVNIEGSLEPIGKLENIEELDLTFSKIDAEIPESFNNLKKLKYFKVSETGIRGKALTNESLEFCWYGKHSNVCKTKDMKCFDMDDKLKNCEGVSDDMISTNDRCGNGNGRCSPGKCCSKYGYCGNTEKHCYPSNGCQSKLGVCFNVPVSTNGKCGPKDGHCPNNECCSKYGYCGNSDKHCFVSNKCQSEFGRCTEDPPVNSKCGSKDGRCPRGQCCNKDGYCGTTREYCSISKGCQNEFGECYSSMTSRCGDNVARCPEGQCCSRYNWCGKSDDHCGKGCQSEFGKCN